MVLGIISGSYTQVAMNKVWD